MHCTAVAVQQHIRVAAAHAANFKNFSPSRERFLKFRPDPPLSPPPAPPHSLCDPSPLSSLFYPLFLIYAALQQYGKRGERGEGRGASCGGEENPYGWGGER